MKKQQEIAPFAGGENARHIEELPEEHRQRHVTLHAALDELVADWLIHNPRVRPSTGTVLDLIEWSFRQMKATRPQSGAEAEAAGRAAYEADSTGPQAAQAPKVGKS